MTIKDARTEQVITEHMYSKSKLKQVLEDHLADVSKDHNTLYKKFYKKVNKYFNAEHYRYKQSRLKRLLRCSKADKKDLIFDIYKEMVILLLPLTEFTLINSPAIKLGSKAHIHDLEASVKDKVCTGAELLGLAYQLNIITLQSTSYGLYLKSNYDIPKDIAKYIKGFKFLPPMVCVPCEIVNNTNVGYYTIQDHLITKWYNRHNEELNYAAINTLQNTPLTLNAPIISKSEITHSGVLKNKVAKATLKNFKKESRETYKEFKDKTFYMLWKYDGRGRMYSSGYHINLHGNDYKRSSIALKQTEVMTERGIYWLKIALANKYGNGMDKQKYSKRIEFAEKALKNNTSYTLADDRFAYLNAMTALKHPERPTGMIMGLDCSSSGTMIIAALMGCKKSLRNVNLTETGEFVDPPMLILNAVRKMQPNSKRLKNISRKNMKDVYMTSIYYSVKKPKQMFGNNTTELFCYYRAIKKKFPGVTKCLKILGNCIDRKADGYDWVTPDFHNCKTLVTFTRKHRIPIDEIGGTRFTHHELIQQPNPANVSIVANLIHSIDAVVARQLVMRCNYDVDMIKATRTVVNQEISMRSDKAVSIIQVEDLNYEVDTVISYPKFNVERVADHVAYMTVADLKSVRTLCNKILKYKPFAVLPIHDEFMCSPNNVDRMRDVFVDVMYDLNRYNVLQFMVYQISGEQIHTTQLNSIEYFKGQYALS